MKKIFTFVAIMCVVLSAMAAEPKLVLDFSSKESNPWTLPEGSSNAAKDRGEFTNDGVTIALESSGGYYLAMSSDKLAGYLMLKAIGELTLPAFDFDVEKIEIEGTSGASDKVKHNVYVRRAEDTIAVSTEATSLKNVTNTFLIAADYQAAGNVYIIKVSGANAQFSKIKIYERDALRVGEPLITPNGGTFVNKAEGVVIATATEGATIQYQIDEAAWQTYSAPIDITESCTLKAKAIKDGMTESDVVSAEFVIVEPDGDGSEANPYTIADVKILNNPGGDKVWVIGYIIGEAKSGTSLQDNESLAGKNIALADAVDSETWIPVQLSNDTEAKAKAKAALNLVDNPTNVGKRVKVYGSLESYFSTTGVKSVTDYAILGGESSAIKVVEASDIYTANGTIYADGAMQIFSITGQDVTEMNGQLKGVYVVKINGKAHKVAVK